MILNHCINVCCHFKSILLHRWSSHCSCLSQSPNPAEKTKPWLKTRDHLTTGSHQPWLPSTCKPTDPWVLLQEYWILVGRTTAIFKPDLIHLNYTPVLWLHLALFAYSKFVHRQTDTWATPPPGFVVVSATIIVFWTTNVGQECPVSGGHPTSGPSAWTMAIFELGIHFFTTAHL